MNRLRQESPWRERRDLRLDEALDIVPVLVEAVDASLYYCDPEPYFTRHPESVERVRGHICSRRQLGFSLPEIVRECTLLRDELLDVLWRHLPPQVESTEAQQMAVAVSCGILDRIVELSVATFSAEEQGQRLCW